LAPVLHLQIRWIDEPEHAPLGLAVEAVHLADRLDRAVEIVPLPHMRQDRSMRVLVIGREVGGGRLRPQPFDRELAELFVQLPELLLFVHTGSFINSYRACRYSRFCRARARSGRRKTARASRMRLSHSSAPALRARGARLRARGRAFADKRPR